MSIIATTPVLNGVVATAAAANATYTAIATGTTALDSTNTQTEWVSQAHIDTTAKDAVFTTDMGTFCNSALTYVLTSETYVAINLGGTTPVRINFAPNLVWDRTGELLRIHADINVDEVGYHDPEAAAWAPDVNLPAIMTSNQDCFFLQLWYQNSVNTWISVGTCEWGYSITNYTEFDVTAVVCGTSTFDFSVQLQNFALSHTRNRLRCSITGWLPSVAGGIKAVELRARLDDNTVIPSVTFKEATMVCAMVRN